MQNDPYVMHKKFPDPQPSPEALERMSFEEKYEGFCVDLIKVPLICFLPALALALALALASRI